MACMEHACRNCGHMWFDNSMDRECPKCGSNESVSHFDERD